MKICIGTAQFNKHYKIGKRKEFTHKDYKNLKIVLDKNLICHFDAAKNYGNAEKIIGKYYFEKRFKIIGKINNLNKISNKKKLRNQIYKQVLDTLNKTKKNKIYGLLLHDLGIINHKNFEIIYEILKEIKKSGYTEKIGISLYFEKELIKVLNKYDDLEIIQFPFNIFDQRILKKTYLDLIKLKKKEIHVRSVFLRGLLVDKEKALLIKCFKQKEKKIINKWLFFLKKEKLDALSVIFDFLKKQSFFELVIIGIESVNNLKEILQKKKIKFRKKINYKAFSSKNEKLILPINW
jgi:aryl-alcohol dehydrogenase-like predicted oxidoreductase